MQHKHKEIKETRKEIKSRKLKKMALEDRKEWEKVMLTAIERKQQNCERREDGHEI